MSEERKLMKVTVTQRSGNQYTGEYHEVKFRLIPHRNLSDLGDCFYFTGIVYNEDGGHTETSVYASEFKYH